MCLYVKQSFVVTKLYGEVCIQDLSQNLSIKTLFFGLIATNTLTHTHTHTYIHSSSSKSEFVELCKCLTIDPDHSKITHKIHSNPLATFWNMLVTDIRIYSEM